LTEISQKDFLHGMTAYPGIVQGRVRVVHDVKKVHDFRVGDVLVSGMTRPEFLPLMKKAAAFITDSGGILSHAAITARELKKPCVINTKHGTKVLKDGDRVEVDANKGIVKKLVGQ
jgi:pyruvate,water dikinase